MKIVEILKDDTQKRIYSAQPMRCSGCEGTGKDKWDDEPKKACRACGGVGIFTATPTRNTINHDTTMLIDKSHSAVLFNLLSLDKIDTMRKGGYITPENFGNIRQRIMQLKNTDLSKYEILQKVEQRTWHTDPSNPQVSTLIPAKVINPAITKEEIKDMLVNFEKILIHAGENNAVVYADESERPF